MAQKDPVRNGEMYRMIADTGGAFVQPALYEAFGLTVVEVRKPRVLFHAAHTV